MHDEEKKRGEEEEGYIDKKIEPRRRMKIKGYRLREGIGQKLKELARGRRLADVSRNVDWIIALGFSLAGETLKTGRAIPPSPPSTPLIKVEILRAVKRPRSLAKSAIPAHGPRFYGPLARENKSNGRPSLNRNCGEEEDGKRREKGGEAVIYICRYRLVEESDKSVETRYV